MPLSRRPVSKLPNSVFSELGWDYFVSAETTDYLTTELVQITTPEQEAFYQAGNLLYEMFVRTGDYILNNNLLDQLGIPANLHTLIRLSWEQDNYLHLFGRFDFAGGVDGLPIKLLEFNADTPTSLPETAIIQWAQLRANGLDEDQQLNFLYEALTDNFRRLLELNPDREPAILFSTLRNAPEDDHNIAVLQEAAREAGFETQFCYVDEVIFDEINGIFAPHPVNGRPLQFPFWFKLIPWEYIAFDEPKLAQILTEIAQRDSTIVLNPAYTLMFQSKAILKYLWDLYPNHPLLLEASLQEPIGRTDYPFVQKVFFGREGSNVSIHDEIGLPIEVREGEYTDQNSVYQAFTNLARDSEGRYYQAGLFFAYESCGLGFRRSSNRIIDNGAQFVGHIVED